MNEEEEAIKYLEFLSNEKCECEACQRAKKEYKTILNLLDKQKNEIEEKTTILLAGAEKVKQLEKGNQSLMESRKKWKNRYYKEKAKNKECISKDKIRELIKNDKENIETLNNSSNFYSAYVQTELEEKRRRLEILQELLEEK